MTTDLFRASQCFKCGNRKDGGHYNIFAITGGMASLRAIFPDANANDMNFVLFSTSGVHGTYTLIEEIEQSLIKYGDSPTFSADEWPDDYCPAHLTVLIVHPRIVCLKYGDIDVTLEDIPYLKRLRESSFAAIAKIGMPAEESDNA